MPTNKGKHQMLLRRLGGAAGGQMLGANLTEVAPGAVSFPFHYHCATEKLAASAGTFDKPIHRWISREGESVDYWDGEPDAQ